MDHFTTAVTTAQPLKKSSASSTGSLPPLEIKFSKTATWKQPGTLIFLTKEAVASERWLVNIPDDVATAALRNAIQEEIFTGKSAEVFPVVDRGRLMLFAGLGEESRLTGTALRIAVRRALGSAYLQNIDTVELIPHATGDADVVAIIEGVLIGTYRWRKYLSPDPDDKTRLGTVLLPVEDKTLFRETVTTCTGVNLTRDLINDNADVVTAEYVEGIVRDLAKDNPKIRLEVLGRKELQAKGLNLHLAVNQGSRKEPRLIIAQYAGADKSAPYTAIVGKGMTFDTGGLNHKPTGSIETMRADMSGSAAVVGALHNTIKLDLKVNALFVLGMAENATGSGAYKPGDVFVGYSGKSVEIGNTDAEGRLVLADAIAYVTKNYKPQRLIDLATLTGAVVVGLGLDYTGLMSNDDAFAEELLKLAQATDDRAWRLPLYEELKGCMKSSFADIKNISNLRAAGTITAAYFLQQFVGDTIWCHLDIAGTAFSDKGQRMYFDCGATGAGVRLLTAYLKSR